MIRATVAQVKGANRLEMPLIQTHACMSPHPVHACPPAYKLAFCLPVTVRSSSNGGLNPFASPEVHPHIHHVYGAFAAFHNARITLVQLLVLLPYASGRGRHKRWLHGRLRAFRLTTRLQNHLPSSSPMALACAAEPHRNTSTHSAANSS